MLGGGKTLKICYFIDSGVVVVVARMNCEYVALIKTFKLLPGLENPSSVTISYLLLPYFAFYWPALVRGSDVIGQFAVPLISLRFWTRCEFPLLKERLRLNVIFFPPLSSSLCQRR